MRVVGKRRGYRVRLDAVPPIACVETSTKLNAAATKLNAVAIARVSMPSPLLD